jgi:putative SOS response-associated peptidase YedK
MRCLIYQLPSDRLHNVAMGITAFLWRDKDTESGAARGPGVPFRTYVQGPEGRQRAVLTWGFRPAWVGEDGLRQLGARPWPWVSVERAPASRIFAQPLRYQRCLVPADVIFVGDPAGAWLQPADNGTRFLGGVWDKGTFGLLTVKAPPGLAALVGSRLPLAILPDDFDRWTSLAVTQVAVLQEIIGRGVTGWSPSPRAPAHEGVVHLRQATAAS